jgi:hypothetical protein
MKKLILIVAMIIATSVFADECEPEIMDCRKIMKLNPVDSDHLPNDIKKDIKQNPNKYVCGYDGDSKDNVGWFAIKKDKTVSFEWSNVANTSRFNKIEYRDNDFYLVMAEVDKYGIKDVWLSGANKIATEIHDVIIKYLFSNTGCAK